MPFGGSFVILIPFWSTGIGKLGLGLLVSQRRNSSCVSPAFSSASSSSISSFGSHEMARWQFWRQIQSPFTAPAFMRDSAIGPCPWPMLMIRRLSLMFFPLDAPRAIRLSFGSAPELRMKMSGVDLVESLKAAPRSKRGDSVNLAPSSLPTKARMPNCTFSGRMERSTRSFWNWVRLVSQWPGRGLDCGFPLMIIDLFQSAWSAFTLCANPSSVFGMIFSSMISSSHLAASQGGSEGAGSFFWRALSGTPGPTMKHFHSTGVIFLACFSMLAVMMKAKSSLSLSNRPRQMLS
mmetsp:Transcript_40459/g.55069  ORF Transcript_40459/g.55069 Transcript_40459/m.55069 type:complete len:292 (+) Transcript_40459:687-1562(+)